MNNTLATPDSPAPDRRSRAGARGRLARILLGVIFGLLAAEGASRLAGFPPRPLSPPRLESKIALLPLDGGLFVYRPFTSFQYRYDPAGDPAGYFGADGRMIYRINNAGFRGPDVPDGRRPPGTVRILCLGDSYTFGEGVREEDAWPAQLQRILNRLEEGVGSSSGTGRNWTRRSGIAEVSRYEVINAGVQALGTRLEERLLRHLLILEPDVAVLGFFMNDAMPDAETIRIQESATEEAALRSPSRLIGYFRDRGRAQRRQNAYLESIARSFEGASWDSCRAQLGRMKQVSDRAGVRLLVVIFPVFWGMEAESPLREQHEKVREACKALGCPCLDLLPVYRGRPSRSLWAHPTDPHPNREAHRLAARAIAEGLFAVPRMSSLP